MPTFHPVILACAMLTSIAVEALGQVVETQDAQSQDAQTLETENVAVDRLLSDLGSSAFSTRQKAAKDILLLDASAVSLLESHLKIAGAGVATQLRVLIPQLRKKLFDDRLDALIANPEPAGAQGMPEWNRFSMIVGDDSDALPVYLQLVQSERDLFAAGMFSASDFTSRLESCSVTLAAQCNGEFDKDFPVANCAALMLAASNPEFRLKGATSTNISTALSDQRFSQLLENGVHARILKAIASAWIERSGIAVDRPLLFAIEHKLPAGRNLAVQVLSKATQNQSTYYALLCLGALEQKNDLATIEQLMTSDKMLWPSRGQSVQELLKDRQLESSYSVQTRDVAMAVAIHLRDRNPREFGMNTEPSKLHLFAVESMGFNNDAERQIALDKYRTEFETARD